MIVTSVRQFGDQFLDGLRSAASDHATDVGFREILSFEEERLSRRAGQGPREEVAEVQAGGMPPFAEAPIRPSRLSHMLRLDWDHHNVGFVKEQIEFAPALQGRLAQSFAGEITPRLWPLLDTARTTPNVEVSPSILDKDGSFRAA